MKKLKKENDIIRTLLTIAIIGIMLFFWGYHTGATRSSGRLSHEQLLTNFENLIKSGDYPYKHYLDDLTVREARQFYSMYSVMGSSGQGRLYLGPILETLCYSVPVGPIPYNESDPVMKECLERCT